MSSSFLLDSKKTQTGNKDVSQKRITNEERRESSKPSTVVGSTGPRGAGVGTRLIPSKSLMSAEEIPSKCVKKNMSVAVGMIQEDAMGRDYGSCLIVRRNLRDATRQRQQVKYPLSGESWKWAGKLKGGTRARMMD